MSRNTVPPGRNTAAQRDVLRRGKKKTSSAYLSPGTPTDNASPNARRPNAVGESYYNNKDFGSVWLSEFLSYETTRNETIAKVDLLNFTKLPGSTVHPHAEKHLVQQAKCSDRKKSPVAGTGRTMSEKERRRLDELSKTLLSKKQTRKTHPRKAQKLTPYFEANTKISRVLKHVKLKTNKEDMQASQLEDFYKLVSKETAAAIAVQSQCRRVLANRYVHMFALKTSKAIKIQSLARGLFARRLLGKLQEEKRKARFIRAKFIRLHIARCRRRKRLQLERGSAVICQSVIRMFFAKCDLRQKRLQHSWDVNQCRWIALSTRLSWRNLRIYFYARQIQCVVRRKLSRRRFMLTFYENIKAAIHIQSVWRRCAAQIKKSDILYKLMLDQKCNKIRVISSEHHYWKQLGEDLSKSSNNRHRNDLEGKKDGLMTKQREIYDQIIALESHYKDQLQLEQQLTPQAIGGGWEEQVKMNLKDTRAMITRAKLDFLFGVEKDLMDFDKQIRNIQSNEDEIFANVNHWSHWRQMEQDMLWDFQRQHDRDMEEMSKKRSIVDEQSRWAVKFYMPSGKPDKRMPLTHCSSSIPNDTSSVSQNGRVQQLVGIVKSKADDFQAKQHLECTFKPFQNIWDKFNSLAIDDGFKLLLQNEVGKKNKQTHLALQSELKEHDTQSRPADLANASDVLDNAVLHYQTKAFPRQLPWNLLDQVREEREDILQTHNRKLMK